MGERGGGESGELTRRPALLRQQIAKSLAVGLSSRREHTVSSGGKSVLLLGGSHVRFSAFAKGGGEALCERPPRDSSSEGQKRSIADFDGRIAAPPPSREEDQEEE